MIRVQNGIPLPRLLSAAVLLVGSLSEPLAAHAAVVRAAAPGDLVLGESGQRAEVFRFAPELAPALEGTAIEERLAIADWPLAPGKRGPVTLRRRDIYAPDAKIYRVEGDLQIEVPRSTLAFFWGTADDDPDTRVFVQIDPATHAMQGLTLTPDGAWDMLPAQALARSSTAAEYVVAVADVLDGTQSKKTWTCGEEELAAKPWMNPIGAGIGTVDLAAEPHALALSSLHTATVAFDTDNELLFNKFADNTTTAGNYIASLTAQMSVIYERDLLVRLVQGTTFLRVGNSSDGDHFNDDPWTQTGAGANGNQLNEFTNYWSTTNAGISRAVAAMVSGKGSTGGASGIAWVPGAMCNVGNSESFSQVFLGGTTPSFGDVLVVAHEIGHNFGSPHTHCYTPPIDTCYNAQNGCYAGATSCPAPTTINGVTNVRGTLMSYCHLLGGGCTSSTVFHPTTVALLNPRLQTAAGVCIFPANVLSVTGISPNKGGTRGGQTVTITGTNFASGATVTIGGVAATNVNFVNATTLTATTPAHASGTTSVLVSKLDASNATLANGYVYASTQANAVSPAAGPLAGGTTIRIQGDNFQSGATVRVGGVLATGVNVVDLQTIDAVTPAGTTGLKNVVVTNLDATTATASNAFFYSDPTAGTDFYTLAPCRVVDTRNATGPTGGPALGAQGSRVFPISGGACGLPSNAVAVSINVTVIAGSAAGTVSVYPGNALPLGTGAVSFGAGATRANNGSYRLATDGTATLGVQNASASAVHVIIDVNGYYR